MGSSSYITNLDGSVVQHVEYVPFGEVFIEERNNTWNTPYLFNGKELDEETGLYYYGARYYNPRESIFLSVDQLVEQTGTPYQYTYQNPIKYTDPTGMSPEGDGGGFFDFLKSKARRNAEEAARAYKKHPEIRSNSVSVSRFGDQGGSAAWSANFTDYEDIRYVNVFTKRGYAHRLTYHPIENSRTEDEDGNYDEIINPKATISAAKPPSYFNRWDHQVAMGVVQGSSEILLGYGSGKALGLLKNSNRITDGLSGIISAQKQARHIAGTAKNGGGYLNSVEDAQSVLNAIHSGKATFLGSSKAGHQVYRFNGVTGTNVNLGAGITGQPTNVFIIKGTKNPSVVPTSPYWTP